MPCEHGVFARVILAKDPINKTGPGVEKLDVAYFRLLDRKTFATAPP